MTPLSPISLSLRELLAGIVDPPAHGELRITGITDDSRAVRPGDLFVAIAGLTVDGHDFADRAVAAGAVAVVGSRPLALSAPSIVVDNPSRVLGLGAARLHGSPAEQLTMIGITGTNGKTTTSYLVESILGADCRRPGVVGTISYRFAGSERPARFTTPTPVALHGLLAEMAAAGCTDLVMEVSSHALQLERIWGCRFAVAAFTHLTQDHLDLHGNMERYLAAKLRLFAEHLRPGGTAVVNLDGDGSAAVVEVVRQRGDLQLIRCSRHDDHADAHWVALTSDLQGLHGTLRLPDATAVEISSPLLGAFNADNLLLAAASARAAGVCAAAIAEGIARQPGVPGRLERIDTTPDQPTILVDYAHTPDALARALEVLRPLCKGRLIAVFGCGGDRDRAKRPLMGSAVARDADLALVTSDNPRGEDPLAIIAEILPGLTQQQMPRLVDLSASRGFVVEPDRQRAIATAVIAATAEDIVLVAGKGHEDYQILGDRRIHFDDREQVRQALAQRRSRP